MTVMITKLNNGEELLGDFEANEDGTYSVSKPVVMQVVGIDPDGGLSVNMLPYIIADPDGNIHALRAESCLYVPQEVSQSVAESYLSNVSGLILAKALPGQ